MSYSSLGAIHKTRGRALISGEGQASTTTKGPSHTTSAAGASCSGRERTAGVLLYAASIRNTLREVRDRARKPTA